MGRHREFDLTEALDAALSVFWAKGYEGTSYEDLTRATGVARPGLYSAFGNKEALFRLAVDRYATTQLAFIDDAMAEPSAREVVRRFLEGAVAVTTARPDSLGCLGINGAIACSDGGEPIRQELVAGRTGTETKLRERLERARAEGDLPADTDCAVLAGYVAATSHGIAVQAKAGVSREALHAVVEHVVRTLPA